MWSKKSEYGNDPKFIDCPPYKKIDSSLRKGLKDPRNKAGKIIEIKVTELSCAETNLFIFKAYHKSEFAY